MSNEQRFDIELDDGHVYEGNLGDVFSMIRSKVSGEFREIKIRPADFAEESTITSSAS